MLLCSLILSFGAQQAQVQLDLPVGLPSQFSTQLVLNDRQVHLDLQRRSLRADNFVIQNSAGENLAIPPSKTYFGVVREMPEIAVVASLEGNGLRASLFGTDGDLIRVSPNLQRSGRWHQIKKAEQPPLDMCASEQLPHDLEADGSNQRATSTPPPSAGGHYLSPHPWQWKMRISRIGFDSTYDHWLREGQTVAGVTASVEYQLAENDLVCSRDAMVSYELTGIVIRQTPYYVGTTSGALLSEFASEWANNQQHIPYESAVLLADYQNDGIAGLAYVGTLGSWGYAGLFWDRGYSPGIIAHEIGHNWGCGHIDCWPWGGSAMCGSWLLYGPESTDIIQWRANQYLQLPVIDPYATPVRPYANPDWVEATIRSDNYFDVLANDYDANFDYLSISSVEQFSQQGATIEIVSGGPGGRDRLLYRPDPTKTGEYSDEFWYTTSDFGGLTHDTPVTISVRDNHLVAAYKFEDNAGSEFSDSSGNGLTITAIPPEMYTDTQDPAIGNQCQNRQWEGSSNFFDNDYGSVFSSDDQGVVSATLTTDVYDGTWLELDYGASTTFNALRHLDVDSSRRWTSKSRLYFSDDHIFDLNDISIDINHHSHGQNVTYPFDDINARFVRWEIIEQFDATSTQHSLGGKEFSLLRDTRMVPLNPPTISLSSNAKTNFDVGNLIDGDNNTSFLSDGQGAVSSSLTTNPLNGTWVEFNFHVPTLIKGVSILDQTNSAAFTEQSRLWFSDTHAFSPADFNSHLSHHNQAELQVFDFSPTNSQYARWEIHDTAFSFIRDNGLREITFFGDIASNPPFSWQSGAFGGFIEIDEKVSAKKNLDSLSRFTISGRIRPAGVITDNTLLFGLGDPNEDDSRYFKVINNSLHFGGYNLGVSLTANSWHMLSASYDGSQLAVYHDGALVASHQPAYSSQVSELRMAPVTVTFPDANYHGGLDEVFVFNYGLSQHSISDLYTGGSALNPSPRDMSRNVGLNPQLSWTAGLNAVAHDIYFGDDYLEVRDGDANSPSFMTRQSQSNYALQNLNPGEWHYWRVDEVNANGSTIKGSVWRFKTELPWTAAIYDGFADGNNGDHLNGLGGGSGFTSSWLAPAANGYLRMSGSIGAYPANIPFNESDGFLQRVGSPSLAMEAERDLDIANVDIDLDSGLSYYMSFAVKLNGTSNSLNAQVALLDSNSGEKILAGVHDGNWSINGIIGDSSSAVTWFNKTYFVIVRVDAKQGSNDVVSLRFYDSSNDLVETSDNDQWHIQVNAADGHNVFDKLFIKAGANGTTLGSHFVEIDEIRVGESWSDVTGL